jgi:hypothetical protein
MSALTAAAAAASDAGVTGSAKKASVIQVMPFSIDYNGTAPVNSYMRVCEQKGELRTHFRGRELVGNEVKLPAQVKGVHAIPATRKLGTASPTRSDDVGDSLEVTGEFSSFILWQHDVSPNVGQVEEALDWFEVADSVSSLLVLVRYVCCVWFIIPGCAQQRASRVPCFSKASLAWSVALIPLSNLSVPPRVCAGFLAILHFIGCTCSAALDMTSRLTSGLLPMCNVLLVYIVLSLHIPVKIKSDPLVNRSKAIVSLFFWP